MNDLIMLKDINLREIINLQKQANKITPNNDYWYGMVSGFLLGKYPKANYNLLQIYTELNTISKKKGLDQQKDYLKIIQFYLSEA